jgi:tetratricopeptide (TPR) repeat protein
MGISSGWRALRRRPATVEASGVLFATVERECTEALPFVRMQRLGDSWTDELRADRIAQVVDYLRKELRALRSYPSNYYTLGAVYMWSGDYRSALAHFDEQIRAALPLNAPETRPSAWLGLLLGVWETKSWQSSIGETEQLRNMLSQEQTLAPSFCSMLHHYCPPVQIGRQIWFFLFNAKRDTQ